MSNAREEAHKTKDPTRFLEVSKYCKELLPQYFENNLMLASIYGVASPLKAAEEYAEAINHAKTSEEKLRSKLLYADFLICNNEYSKALEILKELKSVTDCIDGLLEKAKNDYLIKIKTLLATPNDYLFLLKSDEAVITAIKDGYGFCKTRNVNGIYFSVTGLPTDIAEGDILGQYSFFDSKQGPQLISPKKVGNLYDRILEHDSKEQMY